MTFNCCVVTDITLMLMQPFGVLVFLPYFILVNSYKNPIRFLASYILYIVVYALFLILTGFEYFALIVLIIYVGVVTVIFLFFLITTSDKVNNLVAKKFYNKIVYDNENKQLIILKYSDYKKMFWFKIKISFFVILVVSTTISVGLSNVLIESMNVAWLSSTPLDSISIVEFSLFFNIYWFAIIILGFLLFFVIVGAISITKKFYFIENPTDF